MRDAATLLSSWAYKGSGSDSSQDNRHQVSLIWHAHGGVLQMRTCESGRWTHRIFQKWSFKGCLVAMALHEHGQIAFSARFVYKSESLIRYANLDESMNLRFR